MTPRKPLTVEAMMTDRFDPSQMQKSATYPIDGRNEYKEVEAPRPGSVSDVLQQIDKALHAHSEVVAQLTDRLGGVLSAPRGSGVGMDSHSADEIDAPIVAELGGVLMRLTTLTDWLIDLRNRVAL